MPRLANTSGKDAVKAFRAAGWEALGQVGSDVVMVKPGVRVNLSIPQRKEKAADKCTECEECIEKCPQDIPVPERLKEAHAALAEAG